MSEGAWRCGEGHRRTPPKDGERLLRRVEDMLAHPGVEILHSAGLVECSDGANIYVEPDGSRELTFRIPASRFPVRPEFTDSRSRGPT